MTEVRPGTCVKVRSFRDRRLDELLCELIFKVTCSLASYVVKIRFDIRILLKSRESTRSVHQFRIRWSKYERVRQQNISRQINHEAVRIEFSHDTTLSMIYIWNVVLSNRPKKRNEKCQSCSRWNAVSTMKKMNSDRNAEKNLSRKTEKTSGDLNTIQKIWIRTDEDDLITWRTEAEDTRRNATENEYDDFG